MHSIARGLSRYFTQEHQEVLSSLSVKLAWLFVSLLSFSSLLLQRLFGSNLYGNIISLLAALCNIVLCIRVETGSVSLTRIVIQVRSGFDPDVIRFN